MFLKTASPLRSAAWRVSLWATLAFACGALLVFIVMQRFVADDIQRRTNAWLSGEIEVLADVAEHTPKDRLYHRVVGEVAELASKEVPNRPPSSTPDNDAVFFLQSGAGNDVQLWVGTGDASATLTAILQKRLQPGNPSNIRIPGFTIPFRVISMHIDDGSQIYLGVSERDELRVLSNLRKRFLFLWLLIVLIGFVIVFYSTRRMLGHVRRITEAASRIGQSDLSSRVPTVARHDEIGQLALTLNRMLDRIQNSVHQLHTMTDSLAHDIRSPLTAIRGRLEESLSLYGSGGSPEPIVSAIDELDRLAEFLNTSLDVAEAKADALRLNRSDVDMDELLRAMVDLYEPSMNDRGLKVELRTTGPAKAYVDAALVHRMIANLLDNELNHLPPACTVVMTLQIQAQGTTIIIQDDGPGFSEEILPHIFDQHVKGRLSSGRGLGLAFVEAVARAHGGRVTAFNVEPHGARLEVEIPLSHDEANSFPLSVFEATS